MFTIRSWVGIRQVVRFGDGFATLLPHPRGNGFKMLMRNPFVPPSLPVLRQAPPDGPSWIHELKFDGFRVQLHKRGREAVIYSRNGHDLTSRYPGIQQMLLSGLPQPFPGAGAASRTRSNSATPFLMRGTQVTCAAERAWATPGSYLDGRLPLIVVGAWPPLPRSTGPMTRPHPTDERFRMALRDTEYDGRLGRVEGTIVHRGKLFPTINVNK